MNEFGKEDTLRLIALLREYLGVKKTKQVEHLSYSREGVESLLIKLRLCWGSEAPYKLMLEPTNNTFVDPKKHDALIRYAKAHTIIPEHYAGEEV